MAFKQNRTGSFLLWYRFVAYCIGAVVRFCCLLALQVAVAWVASISLLCIGRIALKAARLISVDVGFITSTYGAIGVDRCLLCLMGLVFLAFYWEFVARLLNQAVKFVLPKLQCESPYVEDCPIGGRDVDLLGRKSFEDKVIDLVLKAPEKDGAQYIGIWGAWGVGKTSVMNRIEWRLLHEMPFLQRPIFVHFDPLKNSGRNDLTGAMFTAMAESLWLRFYGIGGLLGCVGSRLAASRILSAPAIRHWAFDVVRFVLFLFCSDSDLQDRLSKALRNIGRRIVVVIDDMDRLPKEEMCAIVRMLKSVGSLPYVTYVILANEPYLSTGIGSMVPKVSPLKIENGRDYLKKMIVDQLELSAVTDKSFLVKKLQDLVGSDLKRFWFMFNIDDCDHLYFVSHVLENLRDVKRVANGVRAALEGLYSKDGGKCASIDIGDLVVLEAVRMKWHDFYNALPKMFAEFLAKDGRPILEEEFVEKYLKLVPIEGRVAAQTFLFDYLDVRRRQEPMGNPATMQWCWRLNCPTDYKKYEGYRLASEFCFDNYFVTERMAKVVPRAHLETAFDYVESGNLEEIVKTMLEMDDLSSLPELLFVLQNKYQECSNETAEVLFRSLSRLFEYPLKSYKLKSREANYYGVLHAQMLRFAKTLLSRSGDQKLDLKRIVGLETDSFCLFASLLMEEVERIQKGETTWYVGRTELSALVMELYARMGNLWRDGIKAPGAGLKMATANVCRSLRGLDLRSGGQSVYRDWPGVTIPSIEIVIASLGDERAFKDTLWSVLLSIDAYDGAVSSQVVVVDRNASEKVAAAVREAEQFWKGLNVSLSKECPSLSKQWVTFVREGDMVSRNWFSCLAFESFHVSVDVVSFDYYLQIFDNIQYMRREEISNSKHLAPYMHDALSESSLANCFWNKMYKSDLFPGEIRLPREESELSLRVIELLLASRKLAHVDKGLLCHAFNLRDAEDYSLAHGLRHLHAGKRVFLLQDSIYSDDAFAAMIRALDDSQMWKDLYMRQVVGGRMIDSMCPSKWRMRRFGMLICSKMPMLKGIIFRGYGSISK